MSSAPAPSPSIDIPTFSAAGESSGSSSFSDSTSSSPSSPSHNPLMFDPVHKSTLNGEEREDTEEDRLERRRRYSASLLEYTKAQCAVALENFEKLNHIGMGRKEID